MNPKDKKPKPISDKSDASNKKDVFNAQAFLDTPGMAKKVKEFNAGEVVYAQGDAATSVIYLQKGNVRLSVVSEGGKEAVVATLGPGDFFGEGCMAGQSVRMGTASAISPVSALLIEKAEMFRVLHEQQALSDKFIAFMLARSIRIEEDLIDQLFNSSEKRLARTLLLLARYGKDDSPHAVIPAISQETLAEMIGTTRSRVNFFMNKFRKLGFIKYNGVLQINTSLLSVVLHE
jgi:CRP/FNR family cyclic AMP-dependent transcriptional regulator